jgi:hypothetical protein
MMHEVFAALVHLGNWAPGQLGVLGCLGLMGTWALMFLFLNRFELALRADNWLHNCVFTHEVVEL